ncbi:MAG: type II secretion system protein GspL [Pseudomonadales bacterium]
MNDINTASVDYSWILTEKVVFQRIEAVKFSQRKLLQAIPWMLEDRLLQDAAELHFALAANSVGGQQTVAVISKEIMDAVDATVQETANNTPLLADIYQLPCREQCLTIYAEADRTRLRFADRGAVLPTEQLVELLPLWLAAEGIQQVLVCSEENPLEGTSIEHQHQVIALTSQAHAPWINLNQGDYLKRAVNSRRLQYTAAASVLFALLAWLGLSLLDNYQTHQLADDIENHLIQVYEEAYGETPDDVNADILFRQRTAEAHRVLAGFNGNGLVNQLGGALRRCSSCTVTSASIWPGKIELQLAKPNEALRSNLEGLTGISARWTSATTLLVEEDGR